MSDARCKAYTRGVLGGTELAVRKGAIDLRREADPMHLNGFVELTPTLPSETLARLAVEAYRSSRTGTVALALNGVSATLVDRELDSVVKSEGCTRRGVWYLEDHGVSERLLDLAGQATFIVASSDEFAAALTAREIPHMRVEEGMRFLTARPEPPSKRSSRPKRRASQKQNQSGTAATI